MIHLQPLPLHLVQRSDLYRAGLDDQRHLVFYLNGSVLDTEAARRAFAAGHEVAANDLGKSAFAQVAKALGVGEVVPLEVSSADGDWLFAARLGVEWRIMRQSPRPGGGFGYSLGDYAIESPAAAAALLA